MKNQLIEQIKAMPGIKEVQAIGDVAVVVFELRKPVLHDEYGVPLFAGDDIFFVVDGTIKPDKTPNTAIQITPITECFYSYESSQKWINEQKKPQPIYTDPDDGTEFFEGDRVYFFNKLDYSIRDNNVECIFIKNEDSVNSKIFNSLKQFELSLAKFIIDKYK